MAEVLLFHHALGLTPGVRQFAGALERAGHTVHVPDLFEGRVFGDVAAGVGYAREVGFGTIAERGRAAAQEVPSGVVHAGFSLGVLPAQMLAQSAAGAAGALLLEACLPLAEFGGAWPQGVPVQIHGMADDPSFAGEGDLDAARELVAATGGSAELFLYPGDGHLFADPGLPSYDAPAAALLTERVLAFLAALG